MTEQDRPRLGFTTAQYRAELFSPHVVWWYIAVLLAAVPVIALSGQVAWLGPTYFAATSLFLVGFVPALARRRIERGRA